MFEPGSRYENIPLGSVTRADGVEIAYKRRRFVPRGSTLPLLAEVRPAQGERIDLLTARTLGDPLQFWRIADANDTLDLTADLDTFTGHLIRIPVPRPA